MLFLHADATEAVTGVLSLPPRASSPGRGGLGLDVG
jgi:hypothetical protein